MVEEESIIEKVEEYTKNAGFHQLETLRSILQHNSKVQYLQPFISHLDVNTFRTMVPLSSYDDYVDYINQMAEHGKQHHDPPLLSVDPLLCFFYSSGTSSMKPKLIPYFDSTLSQAASFIAHRGSTAVLHRFFPPRPGINKILWFLYADNTTTTKCGFKVMAASSYSLHSGKAKPQQLAVYSSPPQVFLGSIVEHQMYCHLLCGLRNLEAIDAIRTPYAVGLVKAFGLLESKWEQLCDDLECGFPSIEVSDVAMREDVIKALGGPQPELSNRIRLICRGNNDNWGGIAHRLWRNIRYIRCVCTGSMMQYYPKLKYYAGEVPIVGGDYFASECCVGINLDIMQPPETTRFVILPTAAYFEFLPFNMNEESNDAADETVDLSRVEVGKMYEVVVTTYRGFYRYRLGDVVKVVGFYNKSPEVEFVMRAPKTHAEILTEKDLVSAIENFQLAVRGAMMKIEIVEFASFLDQESQPKQLKVFAEVQEESDFMEDKLEESTMILKRCISSLESAFGALYKVEKDKGQVGNLMVFILRPGAFDKLYEVAIRNGTPASQYKPPKIIRNHEIVTLLQKYSFVTLNDN
ncbi:probable indole-3-acetic acid-amido synthetase GH3.6 [Arachis stenosperma]|uniref:probable indole-3-acetic acid-amido synthetase GH3.6 n=1 Tax=Arachis stenosperma TaxID=217475 RepID=UPI0025ACD890|nr:probable indole-3-acetic acid-amido synthetase GH3.6 [Arachis stenosperma]